MTWGLVGFELGVVWSDSPLEVSAVASLFGGGSSLVGVQFFFGLSCAGERTFCFFSLYF